MHYKAGRDGRRGTAGGRFSGITFVRRSAGECQSMPEQDLERELKRLEKEMLDAAKNLEFEKAAQLRDKLYQLKEAMFGVQLPVEN